MKVILLDNIKGIGRAGDLKEVNDGYARNFLFPRKLGKPATDGAIQEAISTRKRFAESQSLGRLQALAVIDALKGATVVLVGKANQKGTLFSGISKKQVADALGKLAGVRIAPDSIEADEHLKTTGLHTVHVRLADDLRTDVAVQIDALQ